MNVKFFVMAIHCHLYMKQKVAYVNYVPELRATDVTVPSKFFLQRKWCHKVRVKVYLTGTMMAAWLKHLLTVTVIYFFLETRDCEI